MRGHGTSPPGGRPCPACASGRTVPVYRVERVPAHTVLLMETRRDAVTFPCGTIDLRHCRSCDLVFNATFDPDLLAYSSRYEETQGFSSTFREFHRKLAQQLIDRWNLRGKRVLEIGCGKGEFLTLLCGLGGNSGIGFDPAYVPERSRTPRGVELRFHAQTYPPGPSTVPREPPPDFVCCKMTLEHVSEAQAFIRDIRDSFANGSRPVVFFQVPDAERIIRDAAFWDVYYEHASYFTQRSLERLFQTCGFDILESWKGYDGQYLMTCARPSGLRRPGRHPPPDGRTAAHCDARDEHSVETFADRVGDAADRWRRRLRSAADKGERACLWGAGSKAVSFLSTVGSDFVSCAVDINPHRQGTYLPGSGLEIISPEELRRLTPSMVLVMNPIYRDEIASHLRMLDIQTDVVSLT